METTNITVRVYKATKKEFDAFCENVGINATAAVNMFIKAVLRTRQLPFTVTDLSMQDKRYYGVQAMEAIKSMREASLANGNSDMTLDEINEEINHARNEAKKPKE